MKSRTTALFLGLVIIAGWLAACSGANGDPAPGDAGATSSGAVVVSCADAGGE
jgi:hypothetical protein